MGSDQVAQRVLNKQTTPHKEKALSTFVSHARRISKGKARVSQEPGGPVATVEDQNRLISNHCIMWDDSDVDHAQGLMA